MRRLYLILPLLGLAGCDVPSPIEAVHGAPAQTVSVQGSTFSVRVAGSDAVAVRRNFDTRAKRAAILPRAGLAMEQASGCRVRPGSLQGDAARVEARLDC